VTLTPDTLVIRNIFTTERVPLADVTEVGFHRGKLTVTSRHGTFASERNTVGIAILNVSRWSGRRTSADAEHRRTARRRQRRRRRRTASS
jgi:hypothetical protein